MPFDPTKILEIIFESAIEHGLSANTALQVAVDTGFGMRRATMLSQFNQILGRVNGLAAFQGVRRNSIPPASAFFTTTRDLKRQFLYVLKAEGLSAQTGELITRYHSISTDELISTAEAEQTAVDQLDDPTQYGNFNLQSISVSHGYIKSNP